MEVGMGLHHKYRGIAVAKIEAFSGFYLCPLSRLVPNPSMKCRGSAEIASRTFGKNAWDGKPGAIISVTPGKLGAFGANHHLRQPMVFLNIPLLQQPEVYLGNVAELFNNRGEMIDRGTKDFLQTFTDAFAGWMLPYMEPPMNEELEL
jgi:hypothetical protein